MPAITAATRGSELNTFPPRSPDISSPLNVHSGATTLSSGSRIREMYPVLLAALLVGIPSLSNGQHANTCNVAPKDQYIEVGASIEIVCRTSCVRGKIFWTLNNRPIDQSLSHTINSSHTVLSLRNFTRRSATLQCLSAVTQQVLGGTTIRTYSKPSKISCILHYKNQSMEGVPQLFTCNWKHHINSSLKINYTVLVSSLRVARTEICSSNVPTCTSIDTHLSDKVHFAVNITVTVRAKTAFWESYSDPGEFHPYNILKIIPPKVNVTVMSDHLLVEWKGSAVQRKCHCQVKYSKAASDETPEELLNKTINHGETGKVVGKVESCSYYRVSVRCALDKAPWSDWSREKTVQTKLSKKDVKLHLWRKVAEPAKSGVRKVHAMWRAIPSTCQGTFRYKIKLCEEKTGACYALCSNSTCGVDVNQDAHRINLTVLHDEALLAEDSVYVPAIGESLPQVTEINTTTNEGVILVRWTAPVQPVRGFMIDWTHNGNQYYWKESKYTNTTLFDLLDKKPYNITVTPLFSDKTGHSTQALQTCSRVGGPGNVTIVSVQATDRSAHVSWNTKSQEECSGAVVNYKVFYSTQRGPVLSPPQTNRTVNNMKQDIFLKDLIPDTHYRVYIEAIAHTGTTRSSERLFKTKRFDPSLITALGVIGSIVIILVLTLGLCCAVQWKKFKEKPVPDPGLSSLALWLLPGHQKGMSPFQAFSNPSESLCDSVYTEEPQRTSTPALDTGCIGNQANDETEEYTDPAAVPVPDAQTEKPLELLEARHEGSSGESTALLSSESSSFNPYRSQSSVEAPAPRANKQWKLAPVKPQEKTAPVTVYITLNMYEQSQCR